MSAYNNPLRGQQSFSRPVTHEDPVAPILAARRLSAKEEYDLMEKKAAEAKAAEAERLAREEAARRAASQRNYETHFQQQKEKGVLAMKDAQDMEVAYRKVYGTDMPQPEAAPESSDASMNKWAAASAAGDGITKASGGRGAGGVIGAGVSGAGQGAAMSGGNPYVAASTSAVAMVAALMEQKAAEKRRKAEIEAQLQQNLAKVEEDTEKKRQSALSNIVASLRSAFIQGG